MRTLLYTCSLLMLVLFVLPVSAIDVAMQNHKSVTSLVGMKMDSSDESGNIELLSKPDWQLVQIIEMNDTVHKPADSTKYTLTLNQDGTVQILADCNRATGRWTYTKPSKLEFSPLASTRAMCPRESLHDLYLAQFEWVRSFIIEDGHLFLSTMADGAIIEFSPIDVSR